MNISENFKLTAGIRFEMPKYPSLKNNYNEDLQDVIWRSKLFY